MRIRQLLIPLLIIMSALGLLHWFVFEMVTWEMVEKPMGLVLFMIVAWLSIPTSLLVGMSPAGKSLMPLIIAGYIWLGTFAIAMFFSIVQLGLVIAGADMPQGWMLYAIPVIVLWSLRINITGPQIKKHKVEGPAFMRGLRIVQISDLHVGQSILGEKWLSGVVDQMNSLKPDLVVVTGDLADGLFEVTSPMLEPLARVSCRKFYVTGNHEYIRGGDWEKRLTELGFESLHNTNAVISRGAGSFLVAGVPDRTVSRFSKGLESSPDKALRTSADVGYKLLLAHEPSSVFDIHQEKCDLILAGHTHGGQIFPFGLLVKIQQPVTAGFKIVSGIRVFAHQGTGFWGPPMRWFTRSEIVEFTWT